jgi:hypothetical protein
MHAFIDIKTHNTTSGGEDHDGTAQGGYNAERILDLFQEPTTDPNTIVLEGGGHEPIFPDSLRELLKDLYVPIGLFTQIKPCTTRSYAHDGTCITDGAFNELDKITSVAYKLGGTRKTVGTKHKQSKRQKIHFENT